MMQKNQLFILIFFVPFLSIGQIEQPDTTTKEPDRDQNFSIKKLRSKIKESPRKD